MLYWCLISAPGSYAVDPVGGNHVFGTLFAQAVVDFRNAKQSITEASENRRTTKRQVRRRTYLQSKDF